MKEVTITQELIDAYPHKSGKYHPHSPFCRLCASLKPFIRHTSTGVKSLWKPQILRIGEKAITVTFRNGTLAYYHISCWNDPLNAIKVEFIKEQETGAWQQALNIRTSLNVHNSCGKQWMDHYGSQMRAATLVLRI